LEGVYGDNGAPLVRGRGGLGKSSCRTYLIATEARNRHWEGGGSTLEAMMGRGKLSFNDLGPLRGA